MWVESRCQQFVKLYGDSNAQPVNYSLITQNVVHKPEASGLPKNLEKVQNLTLYPKPTNQNLHFNKIFRLFTYMLKDETCCSRVLK